MLKYDDQHDRPFAKFSIALARIWFDTLESVALLAGLQVINAKHPSLFLQVLILISLFVIWQYFQGVFERIEFRIFTKFRRLGIWVSSAISAGLAYACYRFAQFAVFTIAGAAQ